MVMRPVVAATLEAVHRALTIREATPVTAKDRLAGRPSVSLRDWPQADRYWRVAQELAKAPETFLPAAPRPALRLLVAEQRGDWRVAPELASALGKKTLLEVPSWRAQTGVR